MDSRPRSEGSFFINGCLQEGLLIPRLELLRLRCLSKPSKHYINIPGLRVGPPDLTLSPRDRAALVTGASQHLVCVWGWGVPPPTPLSVQVQKRKRGRLGHGRPDRPSMDVASGKWPRDLPSSPACSGSLSRGWPTLPLVTGQEGVSQVTSVGPSP